MIRGNNSSRGFDRSGIIFDPNTVKRFAFCESVVCITNHLKEGQKRVCVCFIDRKALNRKYKSLAVDPFPMRRSAAMLAASTNAAIANIEVRIALPLLPDASDEQRVQRAESLAMLGRTDDALAILDASPTLAESPDACNLYATICESRKLWLAARDWYIRANGILTSLAPESNRNGTLERTITGVAFCERKLGHLRQAEAAWQTLIAVSPTAENHFLVAQFYEDTQQAAQAQYHLRQALAIAPDRLDLRRQARHLEEQLLTSHFGCLGLSSAEWNSALTSNETQGYSHARVEKGPEGMK